VPELVEWPNQPPKNSVAANGEAMDDFRILNVRLDGDTVLAVLPCRQLAGQEYREDLRHDYRRLCELPAAVIRLDLRSVEYIDAYFTSPLILLAKSLGKAKRRLTVQASANLEEVFRITKLDHLFEMVSGTGNTSEEKPAEQAVAADRRRD
jgi:anti-anti-sigma regulatory factor